MPLTCPTCGRAIAPADISMQTSIAKCACGEVFGFAAQPAGVAAPAAASAIDTVAKPKEFTVSRAGGNLVLIRRWFSLGSLILLGFSIVWVGAISHKLSTQATLQAQDSIFIAASLFLIYATLAYLFNTTEIRANERTISVQISPIPWLGNKSIQSSSVNRFYNEQQLVNSRNGASQYVKYNVMTLMKNGQKLVLVSFYKPNHAEYVKQQLSQRLELAEGPRSAGRA